VLKINSVCIHGTTEDFLAFVKPFGAFFLLRARQRNSVARLVLLLHECACWAVAEMYHSPTLAEESFYSTLCRYGISYLGHTVICSSSSCVNFISFVPHCSAEGVVNHSK
jgi:hypothetical protein